MKWKLKLMNEKLEYNLWDKTSMGIDKSVFEIGGYMYVNVPRNKNPSRKLNWRTESEYGIKMLLKQHM